MKITQEPKFQPITIVLETKEEVDAVWAAVQDFEIDSGKYRHVLIALADWFTLKAQI